MPEPNLLLICAVAFLAVITLLGALAGIMYVLTYLFPGESDGSDPAVVVAIAAAVAAAYPGMRAARIEENR